MASAFPPCLLKETFSYMSSIPHLSDQSFYSAYLVSVHLVPVSLRIKLSRSVLLLQLASLIRSILAVPKVLSEQLYLREAAGGCRVCRYIYTKQPMAAKYSKLSQARGNFRVAFLCDQYVLMYSGLPLVT